MNERTIHPVITQPVLEVEGLTVDRSGTTVIENASFTIDHGDYVGIVGPNGGGKTSLLLALLKIIPFTKGTVRFFGQDVATFAQWERIAFVSQDATNFDPHFPLSVRELVALGRVNRGNIGRRLHTTDRETVNEALDFMGISDIAHKRIGELSGGQKQRVFVAKALVRNPDILFLDEPVAGVDANMLEGFYKKLSDLNTKKGITILLVSHDLTAVFCRMSKVMCVNREVNIGDITKDIDPDTLLKKAYGEHFHFVFHEHTCKGAFDHA
jgi:zinc transport system ATP-binding protein